MALRVAHGEKVEKHKVFKTGLLSLLNQCVRVTPRASGVRANTEILASPNDDFCGLRQNNGFEFDPYLYSTKR
jgi:hypothetical protein